MSNGIAVIGMACRYPDASSPEELWQNVLAKRQAFRQLPKNRLRSEDYFHPDHDFPDTTYSCKGAVLKDYQFDRTRFKVTGISYRSADIVHWLALDVATEALKSAGYPQGQGLPKDNTGVILGNTLTGEFSRANVMRLRWPYVRRVLEKQLLENGGKPEENTHFLQAMEQKYKAAFPPINEETLAGGLANTIAGRICNYFDLHGGGFTIDGACSSSLLAISQACSGLVAKDMDIALVGGVDLSLDPFEIIGFAKTGALAKSKMRVYDKQSHGFWPGEGCGVVILMREEDALSQDKRIHAVIRGWGVSSDGSGGITRPEKKGQLMAFNRCYSKAGFDVSSVPYFEGHGTGTMLGDTTELSVLTEVNSHRSQNSSNPLPVVASVKANIGHTKAAAGVAGFIKAVMVVKNAILPPNTACEQPHDLITSQGAVLRILEQPEAWPENSPLRAGVSAMGFGGVNSHIVIESNQNLSQKRHLTPKVHNISQSHQDAEIFIFTANDTHHLLGQVRQIATYAGQLSLGELADLAHELYQNYARNTIHAAIVASTPDELSKGLQSLTECLQAEEATMPLIDTQRGVFLGVTEASPRIGFLFAGQAAPVYTNGGLWENRFSEVSEFISKYNLPNIADKRDTRLAQPSIVRSALMAVNTLRKFNIHGHVGVGHSVGEIAALAWAGLLNVKDAFRFSIKRGELIHDYAIGGGGMLGVHTPFEYVEAFLDSFNQNQKETISIAAVNSNNQTVVSGSLINLNKFADSLKNAGVHTTQLPVSHAFHSELLEPVKEHIREYLSTIDINSYKSDQTIYSTITGNLLDATADIRELLSQQLACPVLFTQAITKANEATDLWIEVGPGAILTNFVQRLTDKPAIALDAGSSQLRGLLNALAACHVSGIDIDFTQLFRYRYVKPFCLDWKATFLSSPCESAPIVGNNGIISQMPTVDLENAVPLSESPAPTLSSNNSSLALVKEFIARKAELPADVISDDSHLLGDLHLNSIAVGQVVADVCQSIGLPPPKDPTRYADTTIKNLADAIEDLAKTTPAVSSTEDDRKKNPQGVSAWVRPFIIEPVEVPLVPHALQTDESDWQVISQETDDFFHELTATFAGITPGKGAVICMPVFPREDDFNFILSKIKELMAEHKQYRLVFVHKHSMVTGSALAKTLKLEMPDWDVIVLQIPMAHSKAASWIRKEATSGHGYREVYYDERENRYEPEVRAWTWKDSSSGDYPLTSDDVLLVSGGGKGIGAECALSVAQACGVRLILLGRANPETDQELNQNLERLRSHGVEFIYLIADVSDRETIESAVRHGEKIYGKVTACLHSAGRNQPRLISQLTLHDYRQTLAPKVYGLENILSVLDLDHLKLLVNFGSIIGRAGLEGQADYALANEWSTTITESIRQNYPTCKCLALEWSVWSGAGMGERLGTIEKLEREGIQAIPLNEGLAIFDSLLRCKNVPSKLIIAARFGKLPTLKMAPLTVPLMRFIESIQVYYPGVELVVDTRLSTDKDLYINDHIYQGERLLPGVVGIEAMTQAAMTLQGANEIPQIEAIEFNRPIIIPERGELVMRIAALKQQNGCINVVIRNGSTGFQSDDFRATFVFNKHSDRTANKQSVAWDCPQQPKKRLNLDPQKSFYHGLFFHTGRFMRVAGVRWLKAKEIWVDIAPDTESNWFPSFLPRKWILGDPATRDAFIHSVQACIPHGRLLPIGVERLEIADTQRQEYCYMHARERMRNGDEFTYDIEVYNMEQQLIEAWHGLKLKRIASIELLNSWSSVVAVPYLERRCHEITGWDDITLGMNDFYDDPEKRKRELLDELLKNEETLAKRIDGKPEIIGSNKRLSITHSGRLTLVVSGKRSLGCDIECVDKKEEGVWMSLLGKERFNLAKTIAHETSDSFQSAATRIWSALESIKKAGLSIDQSMSLVKIYPDGLLLLKINKAHVISLAMTFTSLEKPACIAITAVNDEIIGDLQNEESNCNMLLC